MTTESSLDILGRVKQLLPNRWFAWVAPYRDAVIGGLSDSASWAYGLIGYARAQIRLSTAYGVFLDIFSFDYLGPSLVRNGLADGAFRALIKATILQVRVTRAGMISAITTLTGNAPRIFEPWNTFDTGAYSGPFGKYGSMGYGVGQGGWGNMNLPAQAFINVTRGAPSGIPNVGGWGNNVEGYGVGMGEYVGSNLALAGITNTIINQLIALTKSTGTTMWLNIGGTINPLARRPCIFNAKANTQNLAVI